MSVYAPWTEDKNRSWVPGHGPGITTNPAESTTPDAKGPPGTEYKTAPKGVSAKSAHEGMIATAIVIVVVYLLVIVAGVSKGAGRAVLAFFGMAIVIQGLGHTGGVITWVNKHPLTPKG
jgi:predicted phage tail protein